MAIFRIHKKGTRNFWHTFDTKTNQEFSNWNINIDHQGQKIILTMPNGATFPRLEVPIADVRIKVLTGSDETFATTELLRARLVEIGYNPLVTSGGGGSQNLQEVTDEGNITTNEVISSNNSGVSGSSITPLGVFINQSDGANSTNLKSTHEDGYLEVDFIDGGTNATREWVTANVSGGGGSTVVSSNTTATNDTNYTVVANATFTDPSPVEGKGFVVFVRNGTATIGGVGYAVGRIIYRVFHSGAWSSTIYVDQAYIDAKVADSITNGVTTIAPSQNAVFDALALKSDLASPTFTGTPLAPTPTANDNSTKIATTAYVDNSVVVTKVLSADVTTTSTTAVDTNLSHPIASNERLKFSCPLSVTTASGGVKLQITVPTGAVVVGGAVVAQGASTSLRALNLTANTLSVAVSTIALTSPMNLEFTVKNSTTAGNVIVSFASGTGGSTSILENSTMQIFKTQSV
jgi:hypothetical protein